MNCCEVQPFVSALHDGESVSREVADHIRTCSACRARLDDYVRMGVELRLLASSASEETPTRVPHLPPLGRRWRRNLTARVLVPRFALGAGVFAILALSVGLGWMRAQSVGPWFQFEVSNPVMHATVGDLIRVDDPGQGGCLPAGPNGKIAIRVKAQDVRNEVVRLMVWTRVLEAGSGSQVAGTCGEGIDRILDSTPPREFDYMPGQTLEIPVESGGKILLKGEVFRLRPSFPAQWYRVQPESDEISLSKAALVRGHEFLGEVQGGGGATGGNSAVGICVPPLGAFVFALKPFEGAVQGLAEFGEASFSMDGYDYNLFSATAITGGKQPREIWVYRGDSCPPSWRPAPKTPQMIGSGDLTSVLGMLRK